MVTQTKLEDLTADAISGMNESQLSAEAKARYDAAAEIANKYAGPVTEADDEAELSRLMETARRLDQQVDALVRKRDIAEGSERYGRTSRNGHTHSNGYDGRGHQTPGAQFVQAARYKEMSESGIFRSASNRVELTVPYQGSLIDAHKALIWSGTGVGGALVQNDVIPGVKVPILTRELTLLDLIPRSPTTSDTIEFVAETAFINAAAPVAEATATTGTTGTKPESTISFATNTSPVRTIAHWVPVTTRMLADAPALRGYIDARLLLGLNLTLEAQVVSGDGTGENLLGILNAPGINVTAKGTMAGQDAIFQGLQQVRVTGLSNPTAIVLNPVDFGNIRLARENSATGTLGGYLMGPPNLTGPTTLWGLPVVQSLGVPAGTALVGDFAMACMLWDREEGQVRVGWIDQQFIRNMQTLLAELRAAFTVFRGAAFSKITGL
jgi:HK97 family phage major capsid protein